MKYILLSLLAILALGALLTEAKSKKKKSKTHEPAATKHKVPSGFGFRVPALAFRMPFLSGLPFITAQSPFAGQFQDFQGGKGKLPKMKTRTKSKNSTHGPFKTYTVETEVVSDKNKSDPQIFEKVIKSVTTLDKNSSAAKNGSLWKMPPMRHWEFIFGKPFGLLPGMPKPQVCSSTSHCKGKKGKDMYCDAFFNVCKKKVAPGDACTQPGQCTGKCICTWGRCAKNADGLGSVGTFCAKDKQCHGPASEELGCFSQPDISRFSKVCVPRLGEGATCGRFGIFDMFERDDDLNNRCKKALKCRIVGWFGRKMCTHQSVTNAALQDEESSGEDMDMDDY